MFSLNSPIHCLCDALRCCYLCLSNPLIEIEPRVKICRVARFSRRYSTFIGRGSFIGFDFYSSVPLHISSYVMIAGRVSIVGGDHDLAPCGDIPMISAKRPVETPVLTSKGAWIGDDAGIRPWFSTGDGRVVGPG